MPWKETDALKERTRFVLEWEKRWEAGEGLVNMAALCRAFGVSRDTGHRWVKRYQEAGHDLGALQERSRRPHRSPTRTPADIEALLVRARKQWPTWGPRKLRAWLLQRRPELELPCPSTIGAVLKRRGLTRPRKRRRRATPHSRPFADCETPNATWCVDFKGQFRTQDGQLCYPLTILDAHSRFLVRCEALPSTKTLPAWKVFESAFREFGLPAVIRSDNGSPFASTAAGGLTRLSVWWIKLGILPERIEPGKPHQNGRQERMHWTLKQETALPPRASMRAQQRAFDIFRDTYNHERPHEALDNHVPADRFERSPRRYPRRASTPEPDFASEVRSIDALGRFKWGRSKVHVNSALRGELIELYPVGPTEWEVRYGPIVLGLLDGKRPSNGLTRTKHR